VHSRTLRRALVAITCLAWTADAQAQRIIYDGQRDATAQQTVTAAKEVTSGALFAAMLKNVDAQAKLEVDTEIAFLQERMRARLNSFEVWQDPKAVPPAPPTPGVTFDPNAAALCRKSVDCQLKELQRQHQAALAAPPTQADIDARLAAIKTRATALQAELKALQQASKSTDPFIIRAFDALEEQGGDILDYAQKIADLFKSASPAANGVGNALTKIEEGLDQIISLYKAIASIWRGQQAVSVDPASLRPPPQQVELQLLGVEQEHLKAVAKIEARKELEVAAALTGVNTALRQVTAVLNLDLPAIKAGPRPAIERTLKEAADSHRRQPLLVQWEALHAAAGAVAQLDSAAALATLRQSDELRRYSIRRSAVNISTYDLTIQAAAQRLALYWKGGIKPTELAAFVFYITNSIAVPAIALKD
jgi:hypothetical protein